MDKIFDKISYEFMPKIYDKYNLFGKKDITKKQLYGIYCSIFLLIILTTYAIISKALIMLYLVSFVSTIWFLYLLILDIKHNYNNPPHNMSHTLIGTKSNATLDQFFVAYGAITFVGTCASTIFFIGYGIYLLTFIVSYYLMFLVVVITLATLTYKLIFSEKEKKDV